MYENSIIHPKSITHINNDEKIKIFESGTIKVLDDFIKSGEKYFRIKDDFAFYYNKDYYIINFVISQKSDNLKILKSNITMTEFKKIYTNLHCKNLENITSCLNHNKEYFELTDIPKISLPVFDFICTFKNVFIDNIHNNKNKHNSFIEFPIPIALNAQSSKNTWYGEYTWYGDTTIYAIVGYIINDI